LKRFVETEKKNEYRDPRVTKKNRYFDILPGTKSRVILEPCGPDNECTDYINANAHKVRVVQG
jgi:protein tyrosine phosphatase